MSLRLESPNIGHKAAYEAMMDEWEKHGGRLNPGIMKRRGLSYEAWLDYLKLFTAEETCPPQYVPGETFFLMDGETILGGIAIRYRLNEGLLRVGGHIGYGIRPCARGRGYAKAQLRLALERCRELGILRVLVTCDKDNPASAAVIRACGGIKENELTDEEGAVVERFWIELAPFNVYRSEAAYYDLDDRPVVKDDIPFFIELARRRGAHSVLELACGTGRVSIPLAEAGLQVTALDLSNDMLAVFRRKLAALPDDVRRRIEVISGDMTSFDLGKTFDMIIIPFHTIQCLLDEDAARACLAAVRRHLAPGGAFVANAFRPNKALSDGTWADAPPTVQFDVYDAAGKRRVKRVNHNLRTDAQKQTMYVKQVYHVTPDGGAPYEIERFITLRYYYEAQFKALLKSCGLETQEQYGWYDFTPMEGAREMILVCRRGEEEPR